MDCLDVKGKFNKKGEFMIYTFKVSLDKDLYRMIEIKGNKTLFDLAVIILKSYNFNMDHMFGFYNNLKDPYSSDETYELIDDDDDLTMNENAEDLRKTLIEGVFGLKKKMLFLFDYGDEWRFLVECKKVTDPEPKAKYPRIIEKIGKAPEQYPDYDEE